jgi:hypothetical protein
MLTQQDIDEALKWADAEYHSCEPGSNERAIHTLAAVCRLEKERADKLTQTVIDRQIESGANLAMAYEQKIRADLFERQYKEIHDVFASSWNLVGSMAEAFARHESERKEVKT